MILEGMPAGVPVSREAVDRDLRRRQGGHGRGGRMAIEADSCKFLAGIRHGLTLGSPICIAVENSDHANWATAMSADPVSGSTNEAAVISSRHHTSAGTRRSGRGREVRPQ